MKKKILVFSGAGVSSESGVRTFRDSIDGMWHEFKIDEVCHINGWIKNKQKVLDFYNKRKLELLDILPNKSHFIISDLEKYFDVAVVTQNVDCLHEISGSTNVTHLHGQMNKKRSTLDKSIKYDWDNNPIKIGDKCERGSQLRPDICFFGEMLDPGNLEYSRLVATEADVCIVVGTSMQVSPANLIPFTTKEDCLIYYVDPGDVDFKISDYRMAFFYHIKEKATTGMQKVYDDLIKIYKNA
jgi:NAD-dependent deacetylase